MDRHVEWTKAQHELSEASRNAHFWDTMPADQRFRMGVMQSRAKRSQARRRFRQADRLCSDASVAKRIESRVDQSSLR